MTKKSNILTNDELELRNVLVLLMTKPVVQFQAAADVTCSVLIGEKKCQLACIQSLTSHK